MAEAASTSYASEFSSGPRKSLPSRHIPDSSKCRKTQHYTARCHHSTASSHAHQAHGHHAQATHHMTEAAKKHTEHSSTAKA
jgi:hypothetical protein